MKTSSTAPARGKDKPRPKATRAPSPIEVDSLVPLESASGTAAARKRPRQSSGAAGKQLTAHSFFYS